MTVQRFKGVTEGNLTGMGEDDGPTIADVVVDPDLPVRGLHLQVRDRVADR